MLPLLYAAILFLIIRVANDLPRDDNYLAHSPVFIAAEVIGTAIGCILCFRLSRGWVEFCHSRHIGPGVEYGCVLTVPLILIFIVTAISHTDPLALIVSPQEFIVPVAVVELSTLWLYLFIKTSRLEQLYHSQLLHNEQLRASQLATELQLLRSQYHPHFLFNMLNTVYFRIDESNTEARETVEHLANLLRSQLYTGDGKVSVGHELSAIDSYIRLSSLRIGDRLTITTHIDPGLTHSEIYPHLLLPLVENAFKHCGGDYRIGISVHKTHTGLEMTVSNTITPAHDTPHSPTPPSNGLGLRNLTRRLELLYPAPLHRLTLDRSDTMFNAHLSITL